ncbi:MAG: TonB-dependent receptor [Tannerellaceae bacterium]|jgi:TonB-linked SusC/RagA family outer membrane protein|nr:TonB-dependent receptor [Tannerellaceae bacterium]
MRVRSDIRCSLRRLLVFVLFLTFVCNVAGAGIGITQQERKVTGKVLSREDNDVVVGANVWIDGTTIGAVTDINGQFTLANVPAGAKTLVVSCIGLVSQKLPIKSEMTVYLESDSRLLDEVMVVAYGTTKKSSFTGSASMVKSEKLATRPLTDATGALVGATPGVQVSSANGQPGSESSIYIRGLGSFSASNTPLIILNGVPYDNSISSINPGDIESISVLKDASSASLYGARAANGVVIINTKAGNKERTSVNVKFNQGFTARQSADYKTLGVADFLKVHWENQRNQKIKGGTDPVLAGQEAARDLMSGTLVMNPFNVPNDQVVDEYGNLNPNARFMWGDDTDWLGAIQQLGNRTEAGMNVSGGTNTSDYYLSVGYLTESGYIIGSEFERYTMNANINSQITSFLKIGGTLNGNLSESKGNQDEGSNVLGNPFRFTRYVGPIYPIHLHDADTKEYLLDEYGNRQYDFGAGGRPYIGDANPAIDLQNRYDGYKRNTLNAKAYAEIRFLDGFKLTANGAVGANAYLARIAGVYYPEKNNMGTVTSTKSNSFTTTWTFNQLLSYAKDFGKHHADVLVGHESYSWEYNYLTAQKKGMRVDNGNYEFENYNEWNDGTSRTDKYSTEGYLARVNYDYDSRYFVSASARRDGSSRFYKDARWGNFFSFGAGWRIDQEAFMQPLTFIDLLKLRVSYGEVGNDNIGTYYGWQTMYVLSPNGTEPGYIQDNTVRNKKLQWEKSKSSDVALEFELFKNRLTGSAEYFNRQSGNLLFNAPQPVDAGFTGAYQNAGTMYNRGMELELNGKPVQTKDFTWSVGLNAMYLKNKITSLPVDPYNDGVHRIEEGHSIYEFYLRQWAGVNPQNGDCLYIPNEETMTAYNEATDADKAAMNLVELNGKLYTSEVAKAERNWSGVSTPSVSGGFNTAVSWRGVTLSVQFYYQLGGKFYDSGYSSLMTEPYGYPLGSTRHVDILQRWQKENDITSVPRIEFGNTDLYAGTSTRWLTSSDMLELTNATLSYDIPKKLLNRFSVNGLRVYASGDNLLLITSRQGIYPRRNIFSGYSGNVDVYLPARVFTFGLNLTF